LLINNADTCKKIRFGVIMLLFYFISGIMYGIMATPFSKTIDGFENKSQVNHLTHFLLTYHLFPLLRHAGNSSHLSSLPSMAGTKLIQTM